MTRPLAFLLLPSALLSAAHPISIIHDVSVVDVITGQIAPHKDVVIRGDRISEIRRAATHRKETRYIIPGLWDMHVHLWYERPQFPLYIANGVTGVRDMGSDLKRVRKWKSEIAGGELLGPRIYASGAVISTAASDDSKLPVNVVKTPDDARLAFNHYYDEKVDFIKVINLSAPSFEALAELSRHDGIPFAGHLPWSVPASVAAEDRMVSMEHLFGLALACSRKEDELRQRGVIARENKDAKAARAINTEILDTFDPQVAATLWEIFRRYDVRQTPTLTLWGRMTGTGVKAQIENPALRYVERSIRKTWKAPEESADPLDAREFESAVRLTKEMAKAGVPILAGTDTGDPWTVPGFELHKEFALLVKAGLTPAQVLRAATSEPARLMHHENEMGQVKKGYLADLVILSANPLTNIGNARRIETVVVGGKQIDKARINRMLREAAATASKS